MVVFIAICLVVLIILSALYVLQACGRLAGLKHWMENAARIWRRRLIFRVTVFLILLLITVKSVYSLKEWPEYSKDVVTGTEETAYEERYMSEVQSIPFDDVTINTEQTVWKQLLYEQLLYRNYENWGAAGDFDEQWRCYRKQYVDAQEFPPISIDELKELAELFYGTNILPENHRTLSGIEKETPVLEQRMNADVTLFQNEFWLRVSACNADSPDKALYQAGRAADDVFKNLAQGSYSYKEMIFYGGMAVSFYLASVQHYAGNIDLSLVYYRIAEIYFYFYKYRIFPVDMDPSYYIHALLSAEAFLNLAEKEYTKENKDGDILEKLPYFSCYYAEILYKFIVIYDSQGESTVSLCRNYAEKYLDSPYSTGDAKVKTRKSCEDILACLDGISGK